MKRFVVAVACLLLFSTASFAEKGKVDSEAPVAPSMMLSEEDSPLWSEEERIEVLVHMTNSMVSAGEAQKILSSVDDCLQPTSEDRQVVMTKLKRALSEASKVSDPALRRVHPEFPTQYREKYRAGLSAVIMALEKADMDEFVKGTTLLGEFDNWGREHNAEFISPPK